MRRRRAGRAQLLEARCCALTRDAQSVLHRANASAWRAARRVAVACSAPVALLAPRAATAAVHARAEVVVGRIASIAQLARCRRALCNTWAVMHLGGQASARHRASSSTHHTRPAVRTGTVPRATPTQEAAAELCKHWRKTAGCLRRCCASARQRRQPVARIVAPQRLRVKSSARVCSHLNHRIGRNAAACWWDNACRLQAIGSGHQRGDDDGCTHRAGCGAAVCAADAALSHSSFSADEPAGLTGLSALALQPLSEAQAHSKTSAINAAII